MAGDANTLTPLYLQSADGSSGMIVYLQESHVISVNPQDHVYEKVKDSMTGKTLSTSDYFLASGIPVPPSTGTYILGVTDKQMKWIPTRVCE
jgi:hypothetical protein